MLYLAMLAWIGSALSAPIWYWVLWGVCLFIKFVQFLYSIYKAGAKSEKDGE